MHMDRDSAWTTSHIQNKETATHERNAKFELTCVGRGASPRGARWPRIKRCELTKVETAKDRIDHKPRTKIICQRSVYLIGAAIIRFHKTTKEH